MFDELRNPLTEGPKATPEKSLSFESAIQQSFPNLRMTGDRELPSDLFRDRFKYQGPHQEVASAERVFNWLDASESRTLIVSGPAGIGKSVLAWQVMSHIEDKQRVGILVSGADLVMNRALDPLQSYGRKLPYSSVTEVAGAFKKLTELREEYPQIGSQMVLIIDGVDPRQYNPSQMLEASPLISQIRKLGIKTIVMVNAESGREPAPTVEGYLKKLAPYAKDIQHIDLGYDRDGNRLISKR
jgi:hypothetical protein